MRAVDGILAALQTTFAQDNLLGDGNPYRFIAGDPKNSRVWVCDPDAREGYDRNGGRMVITVARGDCQPMNMHLHNRAQSSMTGPKLYSDMYRTPVYVRCEAGNKTQSETLAAICDQVLKYFREDLMTELDIHELKVNAISSPAVLAGVAGEPWQTTVSLAVDTQETFQISEFTNQLNKLRIVSEIKKSAQLIAKTSLTPWVGVTPQNTVAAVSGMISFVGDISVQANAWPRPITYAWTKISGPGTVNFVSPSAISTDASFTLAGNYVIRLTASDSTFSSSVDATVLVQ